MLLSSTIMTVGPKVLEVHWQCKEGEKLRKISDSLKKKKMLVFSLNHYLTNANLQEK